MTQEAPVSFDDVENPAGDDKTRGLSKIEAQHRHDRFKHWQRFGLVIVLILTVLILIWIDIRNGTSYLDEAGKMIIPAITMAIGYTLKGDQG
ncbi:MAG: hypothetical protein MI755_01125 [Sphingomonadales bacterium]|nr:hypothetical protein [Sphingomonadales bacterium]